MRPASAADKGAKRMGLFSVGCKVENHKDPKRSACVPALPVREALTFTWMEEHCLRRARISARKRGVKIQLPTGKVVTRDVGFARIEAAGRETADEVVFALAGDPIGLGSRALAGLNLRVDTRCHRLVSGGPIIAALAWSPGFSRLDVPPAEAGTPCQNGRRGSLSQRERVGVRENGSELPTKVRATAMLPPLNRP